jgi:hypothetical protein
MPIAVSVGPPFSQCIQLGDFFNTKRYLPDLEVTEFSQSVVLSFYLLIP